MAGKITFKHLYEIAVIKSKDPCMELESLQNICQMLAGTARTCGIEIVREIDPLEYEQFLKDREVRIAEYMAELQAAKESKMLRTN